MSEQIITKVYRFANGMVMVFDQHGQQIPEYQGRYEDVVDKIRETGFTDIRWGRNEAMTTTLLSAAPACARKCWCDHSSLYLEIPHISGGPPYIMKLPRDSIGFQKALDILLDAHNAIAPKGGHYNLTSHPATKVVGVTNKVAHDILKKLRMI